MVQAVVRWAQGGRPVCGRQLPNCVNKYRSFSACLGSARAAPRGPALEGPDLEWGKLPARLRAYELGPELGPTVGLAPDERPAPGAGADLAEWLFFISPGGVGASPPSPNPSSLAPRAVTPEVSQLLERWVRRVALGGDQRRGVARLDLGAGRFAGAELLIVAEAGAVSVELTLPAQSTGMDQDIERRLRGRLERRGFSASVNVR